MKRKLLILPILLLISSFAVACSGSATVDLQDYPTIECGGWHIAVGNYVLLDTYTCDDSEYHYQMMMDRKMALLKEQGDAVSRELYRRMWLEAEGVYRGS